MKLLVTGGSGFLGGFLLREAAARGKGGRLMDEGCHFIDAAQGSIDADIEQLTRVHRRCEQPS